MKKYILTLITALCLSAAPVHAQQEDAAGEQPKVEYIVVQSPDGATVTITEEENGKTKEVELDSATYNDYKSKGYSTHKIFKNRVIADADNSGMGVTLMSMCIVLFALIVLSLLFMFFGKIFAKKQSKIKSEATGAAEVDDDDNHDSGEVIAAISAALHEHFNSKHDLEDTVLTIRRMKRAYSPWNSKIYNMREVPALRRKH